MVSPMSEFVPHFEVYEWAAKVQSRRSIPLVVDGHTFDVVVTEHVNGLVGADTRAVMPKRKTPRARAEAVATNERVCELIADIVRATGAAVAIKHVGCASVGVSGRKQPPPASGRPVECSPSTPPATA